VTALVNQKHDSMNVMLAQNATLMDPGAAGAGDRKSVFIYLRPPQGAGLASAGTPASSSMPHLQGDDPTSAPARRPTWCASRPSRISSSG